MIFEKDVYKKKSFYKDIFSRFFNVKESLEYPVQEHSSFYPMAVKEVENLKELKESCSYAAISIKKSGPYLDLQKCTLCLNCLKIDGVEMKEYQVTGEQVISMLFKVQNLNQDLDS